MSEPFTRSKQESRWSAFSLKVWAHIRDYVLPQYGDEGEDPAQEYTFEDCIKHSQRYLARVGKSSRPGEEQRDLMKAAHYIQKAYDRL